MPTEPFVMMFGNASAMLALAVPALLFLYLVWRREWEWIGLYVAVSFGISISVNIHTLLADLSGVYAPYRKPLDALIIGSLLHCGGMVGAMLRPTSLRTFFVALAAMETLFVGVISVYRFAFDLDQGAYFAFNGQDLSNGIGLVATLMLALLPMMIGIPWLLARQSASDKTIIAPALSRYGVLSGIGVVAFMVVSTCFVAWGYIGRGPFSGESQRPAFEMAQSMVSPNMIFGLLMGCILYLFWSFPKHFFDPVVNLLEASQNVDNCKLEDIAHPLWRGVARQLDESRREAFVSQQELAQTKARFEAFFNHAPAAMYIRDLDKRVIMVNQWGARMYGRTPDEMVGLPVMLARDADDIERFDRIDAELHQTGLPQYDEFDFELDSETRRAKCTIFPILNQQGEISQVGALIFDATEEWRAQKALNESHHALHQSEKLAALGQLLAGVAHELNNPLAIVKGRASILRERLAGTRHEEAIIRLGEAADRCTRIVKTFLAMARQVGPQRGPVAINDLVEGALDMTASGLKNAGIMVERELSAEIPEIESDGDQLVQAVINLLVNAQHALESHDGERNLLISTSHDRAKSEVAIEVADTGPGIPAGIAERIFEPFFTTKAVGAGTGLGLSVCKGMVETNGGSLTLSETPGGGATFRIALPVVAPGVAVSEEAPKAPVRRARKLKALVVDDEPDLIEVLTDGLGTLGFECQKAGNGREGLAAIARTRFDAVFCDVRMPEMDGLAFYRALSEKNPELLDRLAFISGDVLHNDVVRLTAEASCPVIEKPFDLDQVRATALALVAAGAKS